MKPFRPFIASLAFLAIFIVLFSHNGALSRTISLSAKKTYFSLFPGALEQALAHADMFGIAHNHDALREWLSIIGPQHFIDRLEAATKSTVGLSCHKEAHAVGEAAYELFGDGAFIQGAEGCFYGYYHGIMEAAIGAHGVGDLTVRLPDTCAYKDHAIAPACLHGAGHGFAVHDDYDIEAAVRDCQALTKEASVASCYDGVWMQNNLAAQDGETVNGHPIQWISRNDPRLPF